jgi:hypothetical protein
MTVSKGITSSSPGDPVARASEMFESLRVAALVPIQVFIFLRQSCAPNPRCD